MVKYILYLNLQLIFKCNSCLWFFSRAINNLFWERQRFGTGDGWYKQDLLRIAPYLSLINRMRNDWHHTVYTVLYVYTYTRRRKYGISFWKEVRPKCINTVNIMWQKECVACSVTCVFQPINYSLPHCASSNSVPRPISPHYLTMAASGGVQWLLQTGKQSSRTDHQWYTSAMMQDPILCQHAASNFSLSAGKDMITKEKRD